MFRGHVRAINVDWSDAAAVCVPHSIEFTSPVKKSTTPWRLIGLIVRALLLLEHVALAFIAPRCSVRPSGCWRYATCAHSGRNKDRRSFMRTYQLNVNRQHVFAHKQRVAALLGMPDRRSLNSR